MRLLAKIANLHRSLFYMLPVLAISGCSTFPTPYGIGAIWDEEANDYVAGYKSDITLDILQHVRCEARDAMIDQAVDLLKDEDYRRFTGTNQFLENLSRNYNAVNTHSSYDIDPRAQLEASLFLSSKISLAFSFEINEDNDNSLTPTLHPSGGTHPVNVGFGTFNSDVLRYGKRSIDLPATDIGQYQNINCPGKNLHSPKKSEKPKDALYPMRGKIDIRKSIDNFFGFLVFDLNAEARKKLAEDVLKNEFSAATNNRINNFSKVRDFSQRVRKCDKPVKTVQCEVDIACFDKVMEAAETNYIKSVQEKAIHPKAAASSTDILRFTTELGGKVSPSIEFTPVHKHRSFKPKSLAASFAASRKDIHEVTVTMTAPDKISVPKPMKELHLATVKDYVYVLKRPVRDVDEEQLEIENKYKVQCEGYFPGKKVAKRKRRGDARSTAPTRSRTTFKFIESSESELRDAEIMHNNLRTQSKREDLFQDIQDIKRQIEN